MGGIKWILERTSGCFSRREGASRETGRSLNLSLFPSRGGVWRKTEQAATGGVSPIAPVVVLRAVGIGGEGFANITVIVVEKSRYPPSSGRIAKGNRYGDGEIGSTHDSASLDSKSGANLGVTLELNGRETPSSFSQVALVEADETAHVVLCLTDKSTSAATAD